MLLIVLKIYAVVSPLLLFAPFGGYALHSWTAAHFISLGCFLAAFILILVASAQPSSPVTKGRRSSFICAAIALFWIFAIEILLPSLARSK
ncbi:MAG: hypothetical protein ABSE90_12725 [Verrucomicrobiota bacterium]|jgi:hypothetical protein